MRYSNEDEKIRREASVPISTRIDVRSVAMICAYFNDNNISVRTVSQLISWSVEMLVGILRDNGKIGTDKPKIEEAFEFLYKNDLLQMGMKRKLQRALSYESLRLDGNDPAEYAPADYKGIHNNNNWSGGTNDQRPFAQQQQYVAPTPVSSGSRTPTLDAWKEQQLRENAQKELKSWKEMRTLDEDGFVVTPTSGDCPSGIVTEEDMNKHRAEEKEREEKLARSKAKVKQEEKDASKREECEIRVRSQEEIEEYRRKRDKEKEEEMDRIG